MKYTEVLSRKFPTVQISVPSSNSTAYEEIIWHGGDALPAQSILDDTMLDLKRRDMWLAIQQERDKRSAGGVKVSGSWFHSDQPSRIQQLALVIMGANMPPNIQWKTMTGAFVPMTPQLAVSIFQSSAASDLTIFAVAEYHHGKMLAAADPEIYDFHNAWPLSYVESPEYISPT